MARTKITILGSGSAAAFAYQACKEFPTDILILTENMRKPHPGAFYYWEMPNSMLERVQHFRSKILYISAGTRIQYELNQWGEVSGDSSFPFSPRIANGWDASAVWDMLWEDATVENIAYPLSDSDIQDLASTTDILIQSFPSKKSQALQPQRVTIGLRQLSSTTAKDCRAIEKLIAETPFADIPNFIFYNGTQLHEFNWVRASRLFGRFSLEYSSEQTKILKYKNLIHVKDLVPGTIPWNQTLAPNILLVGRLATWDRKYLSHHAYEATLRAIQRYRDTGAIL